MSNSGFTPKQRMLNAYRGLASDRYPVAPEFWNYFPAKKLKVDMVEFEREIPFWQSLQQVFVMYGCEGWGAVFPDIVRHDVGINESFKRAGEGRYREEIIYRHNGNEFVTVKEFHSADPSWVVKRLAEPADLAAAVDMLLCPEYELAARDMIDAHRKVGEDYLLEVWLGLPFFDFIAEIIGFEQAALYFIEEDEPTLEHYRGRYTAYQLGLVRSCLDNTDFESYVIGCSYSCNSLLGASLWRKWDKPYIKTIADYLHSRGKLLHIHFHGRSRQTLVDFAEIGVDCVCPFERPPGGDIEGPGSLAEARRLLADKVTFNGNVSTVETLIRGTPADVRREIDEIAAAFEGSTRLIIGTGDQVGYETKDENIEEMISYGKKQKVHTQGGKSDG